MSEEAGELCLEALDIGIDRYHDRVWDHASNQYKKRRGKRSKGDERTGKSDQSRGDGRENGFNGDKAGYSSQDQNSRNREGSGRRSYDRDERRSRDSFDDSRGPRSSRNSLDDTRRRSGRYDDGLSKRSTRDTQNSPANPQSKQGSQRRGSSYRQRPRGDSSPKQFRSSSASKPILSDIHPFASDRARHSFGEHDKGDKNDYSQRPPSPITYDDFRHNRKKT